MNIVWTLNANSDESIMKKLKTAKFYLPLAILVLVGLAANTSYAQLEEPEVVEIAEPKTPFSEGYHNSLGVDVMVNNFGFGIGGTYGRIIAPYTELTLRAGITGIRNDSEQNFQSFLTGQQIIPNKYKRAFGFPFSLGLKQRVFARQVEDNLRFFVSGAAGPAMAFTYPYVRDQDGNGFRTFRATEDGFLVPIERVNDFFSGWSNGETHWGLNGEIKIGVDIGSDFDSRTTVEFGYFFYYFKQGLQIMEPFQPVTNEQGQPLYNEQGFPVERDENGERNPFISAQKYFGTPQIKITFSGMW